MQPLQAALSNPYTLHPYENTEIWSDMSLVDFCQFFVIHTFQNEINICLDSYYLLKTHTRI